MLFVRTTIECVYLSCCRVVQRTPSRENEVDKAVAVTSPQPGSTTIRTTREARICFGIFRFSNGSRQMCGAWNAVEVTRRACVRRIISWTMASTSKSRLRMGIISLLRACSSIMSRILIASATWVGGGAAKRIRRGDAEEEEHDQHIA